jgi:hypothetical protein
MANLGFQLATVRLINARHTGFTDAFADCAGPHETGARWRQQHRWRRQRKRRPPLSTYTSSTEGAGTWKRTIYVVLRRSRLHFTQRGLTRCVCFAPEARKHDNPFGHQTRGQNIGKGLRKSGWFLVHPISLRNFGFLNLIFCRLGYSILVKRSISPSGYSGVRSTNPNGTLCKYGYERAWLLTRFRLFKTNYLTKISHVCPYGPENDTSKRTYLRKYMVSGNGLLVRQNTTGRVVPQFPDPLRPQQIRSNQYRQSFKRTFDN